MSKTWEKYFCLKFLDLKTFKAQCVSVPESLSVISTEGSSAKLIDIPKLPKIYGKVT